MKATIDIPDALYRRVKARSALDGRSIRDVTIELYEGWLAGAAAAADAAPVDRAAAGAAWIERWKAIGDLITPLPGEHRTAREILIDDRR